MFRTAEADTADLNAIIELLADDKLGSNREDFTTPLKHCYKEAFSQIMADPNAMLIVVLDNKKIIGIAQINFIKYLTYQGGTRAQIEGVRIHKNYRSLQSGLVPFKRTL